MDRHMSEFGKVIDYLDARKIWLARVVLPKLEFRNLQGIRAECDGPVLFFMPDSPTRNCFGLTFTGHFPGSSSQSILGYQSVDSEDPEKLLQMIFASEHAPEDARQTLKHSVVDPRFESGLFARCWPYDVHLNVRRGIAYCESPNKELPKEQDANSLLMKAFNYGGWDVKIRNLPKYAGSVPSCAVGASGCPVGSNL